MITICDNFDDIASILGDFLKKNQAIFITCDSDMSDFRNEYKGNILLLGKDGDGVQFILPKQHFTTFIGIISWWIFGSDKILFTWDVKKLFSYFYHRLNRNHIIEVTARIVDIKYGESFLGIEGKCPQTFAEAQLRAKPIVKNDPCWNVHYNIHIPLATKIIPKIETAGIGDIKDRMVRYPFYEIEGQQNGRLRCYHGFDNSILTHTLSKEEKVRFRPKQDNTFVTFDFKSMEVYTLQWLSKDERLGKIISSGRDIYSTIYSLLYGRKCSETERQFIKDAFLPIVYGMQVESLSAHLKIDRDEAESLLIKISGLFSTAMDWVQSQQDKLKQSPIVADYFGRARRYEDRPWVVRNAVIQGPASIVCLEKLIELYDCLFKRCEIVATIHDAYILDAPLSQLYDIIFHAVEVLQSPSLIANGLSLKVDVNYGNSLDSMKPFVL